MRIVGRCRYAAARVLAGIATAPLCAAFLMGTAGSAYAQLPLGEITGDAESGKQLYYDHACYACHGYVNAKQKCPLFSKAEMSPLTVACRTPAAGSHRPWAQGA